MIIITPNRVKPIAKNPQSNASVNKNAAIIVSIKGLNFVLLLYYKDSIIY